MLSAVPARDPDTVAPRAQEVWPHDDWKRVTRGAAYLTTRDVAFYLRCGKPDCSSRTIEPIELRGGLSLRCGCTDRLLTDVVPAHG